jgi:hypothetical protein
MKINAAITDPAQVLRMLRPLAETGKPPSGRDPASIACSPLFAVEGIVCL